MNTLGAKRSKVLAGAERKLYGRDCWTANETRMALQAAWLAADGVTPNDASGGGKGRHFWIATVARMNDEAGRVSYAWFHPSINDRCKIINVRCRQDPDTSLPSVASILVVD